MIAENRNGAHGRHFHILYQTKTSTALATKADDHVHMGDFHALWRFRQIVDLEIVDGNIENLVLTFHEEVMVIRDVRVEVGAGTFHGKNADQAGFSELMQRVVDRGERNGHAGGDRLVMQFLDRQVAITLCEKKIAQSNALARRP